MTLSKREVNKSNGPIFCLSVRVAHKHVALRNFLATEKAKSIRIDGRGYYAFSYDAFDAVIRRLSTRKDQSALFTRLIPGKLVWLLDFKAFEGVTELTSTMLLAVKASCLYSEELPQVNAIEIIGPMGKLCSRSIDDYNTDYLKIYVHNTLSDLPRILFEEPIIVHSHWRRRERINERLPESGRGISYAIKRTLDEVLVEVFPTEIFVLLQIVDEDKGRRLLRYLLDKAMSIRNQEFGDVEKITQWKLANDRAAVTLAAERAAEMVNAVVEHERRTLLRKIAMDEKRITTALAELAKSKKELAINTAKLAGLEPLIRLTVEQTEKVIEELRQMKNVVEVAVVGDELRITTDTIYSTLLLTGESRRVFRIGQVQILLNIAKFSIRFVNVSDPKKGYAAPHIRQGRHGCLDSNIETQVKTHLANQEWSSAAQVCIRLLTASKHEKESEYWPEVDPVTRLSLKPQK